MSRVKIESDGGLRTVTLTYPEKRNIIDDQMREEMRAAFTAVRDDPDATALVVAGEGTAFCGGADLPAIFGDRSRTVAEIRDDLRHVYDAFLVVQSLDIPTIAAVQGPAVGAGLNLAMACDMRIAGPGAKFSAPFSRIGLHPGGGCTWFLVNAIGAQRTLKLLLDGGSIAGQEAVEIGLATCLEDDPLEAATALGRRYASMDPQLTRDIKSTVRTAVRDGFEATLAMEAWAQASSASKPAIQQAMQRFR
ncbi:MULTISPECIES: enoyl-CoA hydratase [unclassified Nocardioides]|uniref:enoyl-CoA hydratase n=1 Tax=unclassified Nocardioides TaxID=2615069 RepID=UPI0009F0D52E|nr:MULTISPECIES: enoyl-CoA hydratase [unclassified Nocardioides]GAW52404.1 Enoyl-CoA hydratase/isomerase [Nocardioides sp. PD653-B2]GAW53926.1 Enoyl-CoA hydratase/isomerase [Nocardioides sp. PD653]